ncbi:MAG TPA: hypothetical protein VFZ86_14750 [Thermoleophilia bacterium]|nr:hypothetical protein [Thermoleophilia bacterium]
MTTTPPPDGGVHDGLPSSGVRWGRFVAGALLAAALLVGAVAAFNLLTDPWGVFGVGIFPPRVNQDRSTKADLLTGLKRPPELLIYGSSRAWTVEAARVEQATGLRTFNAAVTAGRPADAYVFTAVVHDTWPRAEPDFLWLLDVEAFQRGPLPPSLLAESRFSRYLPWRAKAAAQLDELGWLASWSGLQASWEVWKKRPTWEKVRASWLKRIAPDGTVKTQPSSEAGAGPKALARWSEDEVARYRSFARLDADAETYVEKTLQLFASWGGSGVVVLTPTQPQVLAAVRDAGGRRRHAEVLRLLGRLQEQYDFAVVDLTGVESFGGDPSGFFDATHMTTENQRRMIDAALARADERFD